MEQHAQSIQPTTNNDDVRHNADSLIDEIVHATFEHWTQPHEVALRGAYDALAEILPGESERFIKAVWLHFQRNPTLQQCAPESIREAAVDLALSGLDITQKGEAWLIPHDVKRRVGKDRWETTKQCVVWDGYIGRLKLVRQSPDVVDAWPMIVRAGDSYRFCGPAALPEHKFPEGFGDRGSIVGAYCVIQFTDGRIKALQMSKEEIIAHRDQYAKAKDADIWQEFKTEWKNSQRKKSDKENLGFQHMCSKVVVNQLCHPRNVTFNRSSQNIIGRQERVLEDARPLTAADTQPVEPSATTFNSIDELYGEDTSPDKTAFIDRIRNDYQTVISPLVPEVGRAFFAKYFFRCKTWEDMPRFTLKQLSQRNEEWIQTIDRLATNGLPDSCEQWTEEQWMTWVKNPWANGDQKDRTGLIEDLTFLIHQSQVQTVDLYDWLRSQFNKAQESELSDVELKQCIAHFGTYGNDGVTRDLSIEEGAN
ncbi:MAG: recombinase RecT [Gammaproteobacteria bacterium]